MSKALTAFRSTSARAIALGDHEAALRKSDTTQAPLCDDVVRAAAVLAVAAMDTYFTRKFTEVLVPYLKRRAPSKRLVQLLAAAGLDTEEALAMLAMERPYRRVRSLIRAHLSRYTTQHFDKIDELFASLGVAELCKNAEAKAGRKNLLSSVRLLVQRRNDIAHEGDLNSHGKMQAVNGRQLVRRMRDLSRFVEAAETIITNAVTPKRGKAKKPKDPKPLVSTAQAA